tara:strand:- start:188 stop:934 length:747 start_codon:yes stop_codon:yes gene_type:complete
MSETNKPGKVASPLAGLSTIQVFSLGIISGFLVLCTIGFFILLNMYMSGSMPAKDTVVPAPSAAAAPSAAPSGELAPVTDKDHIRGNKKAKITLVEYSDYECPFCSKFHNTMKQVMEKYGDDVRWVYRHFPLSFHQNAKPAAVAAECAGLQGKFWEFSDKLIEDYSALSASKYTQIAKELSLNEKKFADCIKNQQTAKDVDDDIASASKAGVRGTPHTIIIDKDGNQQVISGAQPFANVDAILAGMTK